MKQPPKVATTHNTMPKKKILRYETPSEMKERIEKSIVNMEKGNLVSFTGEEFTQLSKVLSSIK